MLAALPVVVLMLLGDFWFIAAIVVLIVLVILIVVIKCLVLGAFSAAVVGQSCARGAWLDLDWVVVFHVGVVAMGSLCTGCKRVWVIIEQPTTFLMLVVCLKRLVQYIVVSTRMVFILVCIVKQHLSRGRIRCYTLDCTISRTCLITREGVQLVRCLQADTVWYFVSDPFSHTSIVIVSKRRLLQCDLLCLRPVRLRARFTSLWVSTDLLLCVALLLLLVIIISGWSCCLGLGWFTTWDIQVVVLLWSQSWHHL